MDTEQLPAVERHCRAKIAAQYMRKTKNTRARSALDVSLGRALPEELEASLS